jgi:shikimate dehydrogenase
MKNLYTIADLRNWRETTAGIDPPIRLGVFGDPVEHSLSPQMQNAALEHCGIAMRYTRFAIRADELEEALRLLPPLDFVGVNLTVPHKITAVPFMDEMSSDAGRIGAVNTVVVNDGKLVGFNTDGVGFAPAIRSEFGIDLRDLRVMLLGCGGAGQAIAAQCAIEGCERLVLVSRSTSKAEALAAKLQSHFTDARVSGPVARLQPLAWDERLIKAQIANIDLVVNATPAGMRMTDPPPLTGAMLAPHLMIYDTIYAPPRTPLIAAAGEVGARAANGLSMLLHQGARSFELWFGREAPLPVMSAALSAINR